MDSTRDHQGKHTYICGGSQPGQPKVGPCPNTSGMDTINVRSTTVPISWYCDQKTSPGNVIYCGRLDNKMGCADGKYFAAFVDPKDTAGNVIRPNDPKVTKIGQKANDPSRVRTDGVSMPTITSIEAIPE